MARRKEKERFPLPEGRKWVNLNYDDFNKRYPRLGAARLAARTDREGKRKLKELNNYVSANGRRLDGKRIYRYKNRKSPSKRLGTKFASVMVPMDVHVMLKELSKFHKKSMSQIIREHVEPMFDETYKQAELLARIEANRKKDEEALNTDKPRRRYNV